MHVNLRVAYGPCRVTRSDTGQHDLKHLRKGIVERMIRVMGRSGPRAVSLSSCFRGGDNSLPSVFIHDQQRL
jgi:hypothetical protein